MTDSVQYKLECMLPDLTALLEKGLFTKEELKTILEKRSQFEYSIRSSLRTPQDFYKYIQYEQKLEELRKIRAEKLDDGGESSRKRKKELTEYCIVKHIHLIFSQATITFKHDIQLWKQWFAFCKSTNSSQRMSKTLFDSLRYNPQVTELWTIAARWQLEECHNDALARSIMQQGIRNYPSSKTLWIECFRLELDIVEKLVKRRELLEVESTSNESMEQLLNGATAFCVFQEALKHYPTDLNFRKQFLETLQNFSFPSEFNLETQIYETMKRDFPDNPEVWDMEARQAFIQLADEDVLAGVRAAVEIYYNGFSQLRDIDLYSPCLLFLRDVFASLKSEGQSNDALTALYKQMKIVLEMSLKVGLISENAILAFFEITEHEDPEVISLIYQLLTGCSVKELNSHLAGCLDVFPQSVDLSLLKIDQIERRASTKQQAETVKEFLSILRKNKILKTAQIWIKVVDVFFKLKLPRTDLTSLFCGLISKPEKKSQKHAFGVISRHILQTIKKHESFSSATKFAEKLLRVSFLDVGTYIAIIHLFESNISNKADKEQIVKVQKLFEKVIKIYGGHEVEVWVEYLRFEHRFGTGKIGSIYRRAQNSGLRDLKYLEETIRQLH